MIAITTLSITPMILAAAYVIIGLISAVMTCGLNMAHGDMPHSRTRLLIVFLRITLTWPLGLILSGLMVVIKLIRP